MQQYSFSGLVILLLFLASACSPKLTPFTENLRKVNSWKQSDLKKIQFYLSEDVVIRRQIRDASTEIIKGEIKMEDDKRIEEIVIPKGTPGILTDNGDGDKIAITFESGNERFLLFGPNPKQDGRYTLRASEWKQQVGKVKYGGKTYVTAPGDGYACLMVDLKKIKKTDVKSRTATGRTVN